MAIYITTEGSKILSYGKTGDIFINYWPEDPKKPGTPATKSICYWDGNNVRLKGNTMLEKEQATEEINNTDINFIRVIDDLMDALILKNSIKLEDLPYEAQQKYTKRKDLREIINNDIAEQKLKHN